MMNNLENGDSKMYIEKGFIDANDDVAFKRIYEACNIFGHSYKGYQRAGTYHPYRDDVTIWFPKMYPNDTWINTISADETIIFERPVNSAEVREHMNSHINSNIHKRIVFAREKDKLGLLMYRFKGEYEINVQESYKEGCLVWNRVAERVKTFPTKK